MPPPGEMSPHVSQQGLNPVVCSTRGRAASESPGFDRWRCVCTATGCSKEDRPSDWGTSTFFFSPWAESWGRAIAGVVALVVSYSQEDVFRVADWCASQTARVWEKALPWVEEPALSPVPPARPQRGFDLSISATSL